MKRVYVLLGALGAAGLLYAFSRTQRGGEIVSTIVGGAVDNVKSLIGGEEGLRLAVYQDPGKGRAWTVGWGHKILVSDIVRGMKLHPFGPLKVITREEADSLFAKDTEIATHAVDDGVRVLLNSKQRAALISLVFNIGVGAFKSSTLLRKLNAGDFKGAADQFGAWVYDDGKREQFLVDRRERERDLFLA